MIELFMLSQYPSCTYPMMQIPIPNKICKSTQICWWHMHIEGAVVVGGQNGSQPPKR